MRARVHAIEERSRANGPGARFVVWMQGCTLGCAGCFNPQTHAPGGGDELDVAEITARMASAKGVEGLSLSGGEPLQQAEAAAALLDGARALGWSTLAFSGYAIDEIRALAGGPEVLARLDVLIDGRYRASERLAAGLRGSANQQIHLLTARYSQVEIESTPVAEIRIDKYGTAVLTGVDPLKLKR